MKNPLYPSLNLQQQLHPNRLRGLWRLMRGFRLTYTMAVLGLAVAALSKTLTYLLLRDFADEALTQQDGAWPMHYFALGFVGLALFEATFTFISGKLAARATEGATLRLRNFLYDHLQRLPFTYHDNSKTGELIQRATSDVDAVRRFFAEQGTQVGRIVMLFGINFIALLFLNVQLALFSILLIPAIVIISFIFFKKLNVVYEEFQEEEARLSAILQENLSGVRVVKAFARQDFEIDKFEESNQEKFRKGKQLITMHALFWPSTDLVCGAQMLASFYLGARMTIAGDITIGTYLVFANLIIWIIWPIRNLGRLITQASTGLVSYNRLKDILQEPQEVVDSGVAKAPATIKGDIVFDKVSFKYDDHAPVLQDISFTAKAGQTIALLGPTGAGKTSLISLLTRFYDYDSGQITLDGVELKHYSIETLRAAVGMVEQEPFLFSRSIRDNITYSIHREVTEEEIEAAARAAAIHKVILSFPQGYNTLVGEKGVTLSGGQKQRLALARTLLKNPRILVMDDSTSAVDTETETHIQAALNKLLHQRTTFVIAHRIQTVMRADLILVMKEGRIIQRGTHRQLLEEPGLYRQIYDIQASIESDVQSPTPVSPKLNGHHQPTWAAD